MDDSFPRQPREPAPGGGARSWAARIAPTLRLYRPRRIANARRPSFRRDSTRMEPFKVWTVALLLQLGTNDFEEQDVGNHSVRWDGRVRITHALLCALCTSIEP